MTNLTLHSDHLAWQQRVQAENVSKNKQFDFQSYDPRGDNRDDMMKAMMGSSKYATFARNGHMGTNPSDPNSLRDVGPSTYADYTIFSDANPSQYYQRINRPGTSDSRSSYCSRQSCRSVESYQRKSLYDTPKKDPASVLLRRKQNLRKNQDNYRFGGKTNIKEAQGKILDDLVSQSKSGNQGHLRASYAKHMQMLQSEGKRLKSSASNRSLQKPVSRGVSRDAVQRCAKEDSVSRGKTVSATGAAVVGNVPDTIEVLTEDNLQILHRDDQEKLQMEAENGENGVGEDQKEDEDRETEVEEDRAW
eukprot:CAMPEP_0115000052 /NCGR_PEP_ID=MMETSP0216-20121206/16520_1 /TAXON_ID=223996 /ORGANISM="Protocruzia adherens, Strain Boccale" /LENGTH=304 /DNA_ID=CAMNT_0002365061 /DNA_START=97 /DNA_END=1008 /DNA_ORIENTATION=-